MEEKIARYRAPVEGFTLEIELVQEGAKLLYRRLWDGEVVKEAEVMLQQVAQLLSTLPLLGWHIV